jgi:hypothetical protein
MSETAQAKSKIAELRDKSPEAITRRSASISALLSLIVCFF